MDANAYQTFTATTAIYKENLTDTESILYCTLGLAGEVGEIAEKFKKKLRKGGKLTEFINSEDIKKELGDVAWYLARLSAELGIGLDDVLETNKAKLQSRQTRGVLHGEGDNR